MTLLLPLVAVSILALTGADPNGTVFDQASPQLTREERVAALREQAQRRVAEDARWYGPEEIQDIESRYRAMQRPPFGSFAGAAPADMAALIERYPHSTRSGCAALKLAAVSPAAEREKSLTAVIKNYSDAWCDEGIQVGALARAYLAILNVEGGRFEEAERLAGEIASRYPGAIDAAGAPIDDMLFGIRLLRPGKE